MFFKKFKSLFCKDEDLLNNENILLQDEIKQSKSNSLRLQQQLDLCNKTTTISNAEFLRQLDILKKQLEDKNMQLETKLEAIGRKFKQPQQRF